MRRTTVQIGDGDVEGMGCAVSHLESAEASMFLRSRGCGGNASRMVEWCGLWTAISRY